ncbi:MAG: hypothetical protein GY757_22630, partial [bacterium]|nr:hypothetical protein [bacterium]
AGHGAVRQAVVTLRESAAGNYLCAYYVVETGTGAAVPETAALRDYLTALLPEYMVPSYFVRLESIPLTRNGKIDRRALPEPGIESGESYVPPGNETEEKLVGIWSEVLGISRERIGVRDNFFNLGGNSLNLIRMVGKLYKELQTEVPIATVFENPVIEELSRRLVVDVERPEEEVYLLGKPASRHLFCFPPIVGFAPAFSGLAPLLPDFALYSFNFIEEADRVERYTWHITRLQPEGPYTLLGWSAGGTLAFEVAAELEKRGCEIAGVILADSMWMGETNLDFSRMERAFVDGMVANLDSLDAEHLKEEVDKKITAYLKYIRSVKTLPVIDSNIHFISAGEEPKENIENAWIPFTKKTFTRCAGAGNHETMFSPGFVEKNAGIILKILLA